MPCSAIDVNDWRLLAPEPINLTPDDFEQAAHISGPVLGETGQWQTYLNVLGLQGFTQWLQNSAMVVDQEHCSLFQPQYAQAIPAVCNLKIGEFTLCLMVAENLLDDTIAIPRAALELPDFVAHFYVVIEVQEEQGHVMIRGHGRYDQLARYRQRVNLGANDSWNYLFPLFLFDGEPHHLLFHLRFLDAAAIALPTQTSQLASPPITQFDLTTLLSDLRSAEQRLWHSLTWAQGATLLQNFHLLDLLYQWQQSLEKTTSLRIRIAEVFTLLTQQTMNTAQWLQEELDHFSQSLGWQSIRRLAAGTPEFRSGNRFTIAIEELRYQGMEIPNQLSPVFKTIEWEAELLQIYAATWRVNATTHTTAPQWALLLILRNQLGAFLPDGLKLRIADLAGAVQVEEDALETELLYVRATANQGTKLAATIISPAGQVLPLDSYCFDPVSTA